MTIYSGIRSGVRSGVRSGISPGNYPLNASELANAVGYGTWSAAWLCDEASGNLQPAFGSPALESANTPLYGLAGPLGGADKAVGFDASTDGFTCAGFSIAADADLIMLLVAKPLGSATVGLLGTVNVGDRFGLSASTSNSIVFRATDPTAYVSSVADATTSGGWMVIIGGLSRTTDTLRVGGRTFAGSGKEGDLIDITLLGDVSPAGTLNLGANAVQPAAPEGWEIAYVALGTGVGAGTGLPENIATACQNFSRSLGGS